jgi:hypothetical protein
LKIWKNPVFWVVVVAVTLIAASFTVTAAPETAAPDGSSTVPLSDPRVCCARPGTAEIHAAKMSKLRDAALLHENRCMVSSQILVGS